MAKREPTTTSDRTAAPSVDDSDADLPIRMLHDRVLVNTEGEQGERRSGY